MTLIVASCFLVAWALDRQFLPSVAVVSAQLYANLALLILCICLLLAAMQAVQVLSGQVPNPERLGPNHFAICERGRTIEVPMSEIEWIEAQGNYQALHTQSGVHLYRATSTEIERKLDATLFVRIHRRYLVALAAIERLEPLTSGGGVVVPASGAQLRQARRNRATLRQRLRNG